MKHLFKYTLLILSFVIISCDDVKDEVPVYQEISTDEVKLHVNNEAVVIPIYGDFQHGAMDVRSASGELRTLSTNQSLYGVTFVKYIPEGSESEVVDLEIVQGNRIVGTGSVQVKKVAEGARTGTAISTGYEVAVGEDNLEINLLEAMGGNLEAPTSVEVRVIPVRDARGAYISISENESGTLDLQLNYSRLGCLAGDHEFVFELCIEPSKPFGEAWDDPVNNCKTYTTALTTFHVE